MDLKIILFIAFFAFLTSPASTSSLSSEKPNIFFILADDLGYNDVGYHNSEVISPNIDRLASEGIILERSYVQPICTPSRASLLTGMYTHHIGRQKLSGPLDPDQPTGLALNRTLLPQYLKQAGYSTHMIGKWHLGFCKQEYLPTARGFDSYFGYWGPTEDYYTKTMKVMGDPKLYYDFHLNDDLFFDNTTYSLDLYTNRMKELIENHHQEKNNPMFMYLALQSVHVPLAVPQHYEDLYPNIEDQTRKTYLGIVTAMDDLIGELVDSLQANEMYENSIIVFVSDNGGNYRNGGASNYPLAQGKGTFAEGGVRTPAFLHSPSLLNENQKGTVNEKIIHISDWLPTLANLAELHSDQLPNDLDGIDQTEAILGKNSSIIARKMVINQLNHLPGTNNERYQGAIQIEDGWKLLMNPGRTGQNSDQYYLYNVITDPGEVIILNDDYPELLQSMIEQINEYAQDMIPEDNPDATDADISDGNGNFATGWC